MTTRKANQLIALLDKSALDWARYHGGYPEQHYLIGNHVVTVAVNENGQPSVDWYTLAEASEWLDGIRALRRKHRDMELWEAISEAMPARP